MPKSVPIAEHWLVPDNAYGVACAARVFLPFAFLIAALPHAVEAFGYWVVAVFAVLIGILAHKATMIMHDCCHYTLFSSKTANIWVGRFFGTLIGSSFTQFKTVHFQHHRHLGETVDPQAPDYVGAKKLSRAALIWHLCKPLCGFSFFKVLLFATPRNAAKPGARRLDLSVLAGLASIALVQVIIALVASDFLGKPELALVYPLSAVTIGLFLSRIRSFCEHVSLPETPSERHVRSHRSNMIDNFVFWEANFNRHREHHAFPTVVSKFLPELASSLDAREGSSDREQSISSSILETLKFRLAQAR